MYRPVTPFNVPMMLLVPEQRTVKGVTKLVYPEQGDCFFGSFRTFGGTEKTVNDAYTVEDTAVIDTWYRPEFSEVCRIYIPESKKTYEVVGTPEDIGMRHQYTQMRVKRLKNG